MNNTLNLLIKIIYISNIDKKLKGLNNIFIFSFISGISELIIFGSSLYIINLLIDKKEIIFNPSLLLIAILIGSILRIISCKKLIKFTHYIGSNIGQSILDKRLRNKKIHQNQNNIDDNITVSIVNYTQIFVSALQNIALALAAIMGIFWIILILSISNYVNSILIIFLISIIYITVNKINSFKLLRISKEIARNQRSVLTNTRDALDMDEEIYIYKSFSFYKEKLFRSQFKLMSNLANSSFISSLPKLVIELFILSFISVLLIIDYQNYKEISYLNYTVVLLISCLRIVPYAQSIYAAQSSIKIYNDPIDILYQYLNENFTVKKADKIISKNVNFRLKLIDKKADTKNRTIARYKIQNKSQILSLNIKENQIIGIKGISGCGKSTLIRSMIGLRNEYETELFIKNKILSKTETQFITNYLKIGFIPQKSYIYSGSIKENILQSEIFEDEEIIKLLIKFNLIKNKFEANKFLNEKIGENSTLNLSGGEIQRISLIRALIRRPEILFIDEGTSGLDEDNSKNIMETLLDYVKSVVMISHSNKIEKYFDKIIIFENIL